MENKDIMGFCIKCKKYYPDPRMAGGKCPKGHFLLHSHKCQYCNRILYFQSDDDYCGPEKEFGIICDVCAKKMAEE